jgi:PAS domain-containing protein
MRHETVIELAAGLCAVVGVTLGGLSLWATVKLREARSTSVGCERARAEALAVLDTVPLAAYRWPVGCDPDGHPVRAVAYPKFLASLNPGDAAQLEAGRLALHRDGTAFSLTVGLSSGGGAFAVEGRQSAMGETVLWLLDGNAAALARQASVEAANLRELVDAIPAPIWRRDRDHVMVDCNRAYASALDSTRELVLAEGRQLAPTDTREPAVGCAGKTADAEQRNARRHVVIGGSRRLLDITELPCSDGGAIGFAFDCTEVDTAETELRRHVGAHAQVLESVGAAVAIYGADQRLKFFNAAFAGLWGLEAEWLSVERCILLQ